MARQLNEWERASFKEFNDYVRNSFGSWRDKDNKDNKNKNNK